MRSSRATQAGKAAGDDVRRRVLEANARRRAPSRRAAGCSPITATTDADLSDRRRARRTAPASGWAAGGARDWGQIDPAALGRVAAQKAVAQPQSAAIEPGLYTVVLEPQAVADLVPLLVGAFNARTADEGRSPFSKQGGGTQIGEKVADERVTLYSDPADPDLLGQPFDGEGLPLGRTVWIENGILKNLAYSRFWAQKQGKQPTGGGGGAAGRRCGGGLKLAGGTKTTDELIAGTERGVLVTHFFYIRSLDPRTVLQTGLTRDGTFLIENGKIDAGAEELPLEREPAVHAEQDRGDRARRADVGGRGAARHQGAGFHVHVSLGRRVVSTGASAS